MEEENEIEIEIAEEDIPVLTLIRIEGEELIDVQTKIVIAENPIPIKEIGKSMLLGTTIEVDEPEILAYKYEPVVEKGVKCVKAIIPKGTQYIVLDSLRYKTTRLFYL